MMKINKENWEYKSFLSCIEKVPKPKQLTTSDYKKSGAIPIVSQDAKLITGYTNHEELKNKFDKPVIVFGDHTRVLKYIDFDFVVGADGVKIIIPKGNLLTKFLYYFLVWHKIPNLGYARHFKLLKDIMIPIPPINTQNYFISLFDKYQDLIFLKQEQLKEFDALEQSVFYKMFQNDEKILTKKLVDIAEVGSSRRVFASEFVSEGVPFYRGTEISMLSIGQKFRPTLYITSQRYEELIKVKGKPVIGDLLLPSICNDGKIWVVNTDNPFYIKDGRVLWIHPKDKAITDSFYLKYVIKFYLINNFHKLASGTTFAEMKIFNLKKIPVPLPSLSLQKSFAQKIETIEKQKTVVQDEITQLQALLDSEMDKYFG